MVIVAAGYRSAENLSGKIAEALPNVALYTVGDATRARTAWQAIQEGNHAGRMIRGKDSSNRQGRPALLLR